MRFAGEVLTPAEAQNPVVVPSTVDVKYPQDRKPAGSFGKNGVHPTLLPLMKQRTIESPKGGVT